MIFKNSEIFFSNIIPDCLSTLTRKKNSIKSFDQKFIGKKMKLLQLFMKKIIQNENLIDSESLSAFLNVVDKNLFKRRYKDMINLNP